MTEQAQDGEEKNEKKEDEENDWVTSSSGHPSESFKKLWDQGPPPIPSSTLASPPPASPLSPFLRRSAIPAKPSPTTTSLSSSTTTNHQQAILEIPLEVIYETVVVDDDNKDAKIGPNRQQQEQVIGLALAPSPRLSIQSTGLLSRSWSTHLSTSTNVKGRLGYSSSQAELIYHHRQQPPSPPRTSSFKSLSKSPSSSFPSFSFGGASSDWGQLQQVKGGMSLIADQAYGHLSGCGQVAPHTTLSAHLRAPLIRFEEEDRRNKVGSPPSWSAARPPLWTATLTTTLANSSSSSAETAPSLSFLRGWRPISAISCTVGPSSSSFSSRPRLASMQIQGTIPTRHAWNWSCGYHWTTTVRGRDPPLFIGSQARVPTLAPKSSGQTPFWWSLSVHPIWRRSVPSQELLEASVGYRDAHWYAGLCWTHQAASSKSSTMASSSSSSSPSSSSSTHPGHPEEDRPGGNSHASTGRAPGQKKSLFQVGWRHSSTTGLTWVFSWSQGDFHLRIPIRILPLNSSPSSSSSSLVLLTPTAVGAFLGHHLSYCLLVLYLSAVSRVIHDVIGHILWTQSPASGLLKPNLQEWRQLRREKARMEALQQQQLMEKQATSRRQNEMKIQGLVILHAVYAIDGHGHSPPESFDVTIPMQFWVHDSVLELPADVSKGHMLGFYTLSAFSPGDYEEQQVKTDDEQGWWSGFWMGSNRSPQSKLLRPKPLLNIEYSIAGSKYCITVQDDEGIQLPSSRAEVVDAANSPAGTS